MSTPPSDVIRAALASVLPRVRSGMQYQHEQAEARGQRLPGVQRRTIEQTLWELFKAGLLVTPEIEDVLDAARKWREGWSGDPIETPDDDPTEEDCILYHAIGELS